MTAALIDCSQPDQALREVVEQLQALDPSGERFAKVFRRTFDQIYDGQDTGRYDLQQLFKTEKAHFGTRIEVNIQREFELKDGSVLDYSIAGHEVDCKYSHSGAWMLPPECFDQLAMVTTADDRSATWSIGVVRASEFNLNPSRNRDGKATLSTVGRGRIVWIFHNQLMQPNALLQLPSQLVEDVMSKKSGQARVNHLFRIATNLRISRTIVATVAQQADFMKRVRENGGARSALRQEGILILSGDYHRQRTIAESLGAVVPEPGEFVSVPVTPSRAGVGALIIGSWWRMAADDETPWSPAPAVGVKASEEL